MPADPVDLGPVDPGMARYAATNHNQIREFQMNWNQVEGNWEKFKGQVQQKWGKLTNDDLDVIKGKRKELAGRLQARYGKDSEQAEKDIDDWLTRH